MFQATLECLNRSGVKVLNAEARELLAEAGARVDDVRVRIPPHIIQEAIAATPRSFTIWGRDREGQNDDESGSLGENRAAPANAGSV